MKRSAKLLGFWFLSFLASSVFWVPEAEVVCVRFRSNSFQFNFSFDVFVSVLGSFVFFLTNELDLHSYFQGTF